MTEILSPWQQSMDLKTSAKPPSLITSRKSSTAEKYHLLL